MASDFLIALCSCPDISTAEKIAETIVVEDKLAACVNIIPEVQSIYSWKGKKENSSECMLLIKTNKACYNDLESQIVHLHPYEVPEIIAIPVEQGFAAYLDWVAQSCRE